MRSTYTFAKLEVSQQAYDEIREKLVEAGYEHAFGLDDDVELMDMHGIALVRAQLKEMQLTPEEARLIIADMDSPDAFGDLTDEETDTWDAAVTKLHLLAGMTEQTPRRDE